VRGSIQQAMSPTTARLPARLPRRGTLPQPLHAVRIGAAVGRDHRASRTCWCGPVAMLRDLETMRTIFVHRNPPPAPRSRREG